MPTYEEVTKLPDQYECGLMRCAMCGTKLSRGENVRKNITQYYYCKRCKKVLWYFE